MNNLSLMARIKSLETQLGVLRAQLESGYRKNISENRFADLYGILSGKSDTQEEEIRAVEFHFDWDEKTGR
jgi:hypothetical protein